MYILGLKPQCLLNYIVSSDHCCSAHLTLRVHIALFNPWCESEVSIRNLNIGCTFPELLTREAS